MTIIVPKGKSSHHHESRQNPFHFHHVKHTASTTSGIRLSSSRLVESQTNYGYDPSFSPLVESNNIYQSYYSFSRHCYFVNTRLTNNVSSSPSACNHYRNQLFYPSWVRTETTTDQHHYSHSSLTQNPNCERFRQVEVGYQANVLETTTTTERQDVNKKQKCNNNNQKENTEAKTIKKSNRRPQKRYSGLAGKSAYFCKNSLAASTANALIDTTNKPRNSSSSDTSMIPLTTNVSRAVEVMDPTSKCRLHLFPSCSEASRAMNVNRTKISRTCRNGGGKIGPLFFQYIEQHTLEISSRKLCTTHVDPVAKLDDPSVADAVSALLMLS